jgi:uncharacterized Zn finger protein (UPF0148 family)
MNDLDNTLLKTFFAKRQAFNAFIKAKKIPFYTCPGCAYPTVEERGGHSVCPVCNWEDNGEDDHLKNVFTEFVEEEEEKKRGPNAMTLTENRIAIGQTLHDIAQAKQGKINLNPREVLVILARHEKEIKKIYKLIPLTADATHKGWQQAKKVKLALLEQLCS